MNNNTEHKTPFARFKEERLKGNFTYYEEEEIDAIVFTLRNVFDFDAANEAIDMGLTFHPGSIFLRKLRIWVLIDSLEFEKAEEAFKEFENDGTDATEELKISLLVAKEQYEEAYQKMAEGVTQNTLSHKSLLDLLENVYTRFPPKTFCEYMLKLADLIREDAELLKDIAQLLQDIAEYPTAAKMLNRSLDVNSYDVLAWRNLANCYFYMKKYKPCMEACDFGLAINEYEIGLHIYKAYAYTLKRKNEKAIAEIELMLSYLKEEGPIMEKATEGMHPMEVEAQLDAAYELLISCYTDMDNIDQAIEVAIALRDRHPNDSDRYVKVATLYLDRGNTPKALAFIKAALKLKPKSLNLLAFKANVLVTMGRGEEALKTYDAMLKLDPNLVFAWLSKGIVYKQLKRYEEADEAYNAVLKLKPKDKETREMLWEYFTSTGNEEALKALNMKKK